MKCLFLSDIPPHHHLTWFQSFFNNTFDQQKLILVQSVFQTRCSEPTVACALSLGLHVSIFTKFHQVYFHTTTVGEAECLNSLSTVFSHGDVWFVGGVSCSLLTVEAC